MPALARAHLTGFIVAGAAGPGRRSRRGCTNRGNPLHARSARRDSGARPCPDSPARPRSARRLGYPLAAVPTALRRIGAAEQVTLRMFYTAAVLLQQAYRQRLLPALGAPWPVMWAPIPSRSPLKRSKPFGLHWGRLRPSCSLIWKTCPLPSSSPYRPGQGSDGTSSVASGSST
jgi:hypothetical protein